MFRNALLLACMILHFSAAPAAEPQHVFIGYDYDLRLAPGEGSATAGHALGRGQIVAPTRSATDGEGLLWLGWMVGETAVWVPDALIAHVAPENLREGDLPIGEERVDRWRALPLDYRPSDLVAVDRAFTYYPDRDCLMREEAARQAEAMFSAAKVDGLALRVFSAYRPASVQRDLYLNKIAKTSYHQQTVAKPGTSEHQLGTAMDINGLDEKTLVVGAFGDTPEGQWVKANCARFGFVISYTEENSVTTGYETEPWHLRYVGMEKATDWKPMGKPE